jgi:Na+-translocating ferredoxin:NAD+ oxidoreductase subunit D
MRVRTSPHIRSAVTTDVIMLNVVYALLPVCAFAVWAFGLSALFLLTTTTGACVLTEYLFCRASGKAVTINDYSAVITGLLLGLTLPPGFPLWMGAVGGFIAIALGKAIFGGLGFNLFNPALVARAFLQAAFPVAITTWTPGWAPGRFWEFVPSSLALPFLKMPEMVSWVNEKAVDGFSGATPLALMKFEHVGTSPLRLMTGMTAGSAGETCAVLILLGGLYLAWRRMLDWRIPAAVLGSVILFSGIFWMVNRENPSPVFMLFSGGLMLGAVFMATDMVTSPSTPLGVWLYGTLIGFLVVLIRLKGGLPEGVMYAILLGNAVTPILNDLTQPRVYGTRRKAGAHE